MNALESARLLNDEIVNNRRSLHQKAEIGFDLPETFDFVWKKLESYGYKPEKSGKSGIVCTTGKGGKTFLLRADMDALPMKEETGLDYACTNGNAHTCGHDIHTAMLLGAAKLLKQYEAELKGTVKFMFQPAEEILAGAKDMVAAGILKGVDAAMALHILIGTDKSDAGTIYYNDGGITYSGDAYTVRIKGVDAHGSTPYLGVDAVNIAAHIVVALQSIINKNVSAREVGIVLAGKISGGTAVNTVAGSAEIEVSARALDPEVRATLRKKIVEISENTARVFGGEAVVEHIYGMAPLVNEPKLTEELKNICISMLGAEKVKKMIMLSGAEDFSFIAEQIPAVLFTLGLGGEGEGYKHALHHPAMIVNEKYLYVGSATYVNCAIEWLKNNINL